MITLSSPTFSFDKALHTALALACLAFSPTARADENLFGYTYGAETLPKGKSEFYIYNTFRSDKGDGHYLGWDQTFEYEYGWTDRLQTSLYLNFNYVDIENVRDMANKEADFGFRSVQMAFKYNVLSPFKDPVGLSFYLEPGYVARDFESGDSLEGYEIEAMIILQKNFLDDTLIWSTNIFAEFGSEDGDEGWGPTIFTGLTYRVAPNWFVGFEGHWDADFEGLQWSDMQHWDLFAGPAIHYGGKTWGAVLSAQANLASWPDTPGHDRNLDDHEQFEVRLKLYWNF